MASQWSGLSPAVNSHLARWGRNDKEWQKLQESARRQERQNPGGEKSFALTAEQYPLAYMWSIFARSWGLPTPDGGVVTPEATNPVEGMTINGKEQFISSAASEKNGIALMEREHILLDRAETVYVSGEIVDRITYAAESIDPEPLHATDLFAPSGLIVLEKPIKLPDYHPGTGIMTDFIHVGIRAIGWTPEIVRCTDAEEYDPAEGATNFNEKRPGTMIFTYTTNDDWRNTYARDVTKAMKDGNLTKEEVERIFLGTEMADPDDFYNSAVYTMGALAGRDHLIPSDVMAWAFGRKWGQRNDLLYVPGTVDSTVSYMRRWFLTLMRFSWQQLVVPHRPSPSKKMHSRLVHFRRPHALFSVLRLRRTTERTYETGTGQRLTYRVKTRGHWRNVYVPTLGPAKIDGHYNPASHRRQWIEAFWRGPIDGPLGPDHKATVIVR
jgi:hypothetical protein